VSDAKTGAVETKIEHAKNQMHSRWKNANSVTQDANEKKNPLIQKKVMRVLPMQVHTALGTFVLDS